MRRRLINTEKVLVPLRRRSTYEFVFELLQHGRVDLGHPHGFDGDRLVAEYSLKHGAEAAFACVQGHYFVS